MNPRLAALDSQLSGRQIGAYSVPKTWKDYEGEYVERKGSKVSKSAQIKALANTIFDRQGNVNMGGWKKVGEAFVGPVLIRLKYEGVVRDLIMEKPLPQGKLPIFPVMDQLGKAYVLNENAGDVWVERFEGKQVLIHMFRVAAYPQISKAEVYALDFDAINYMKDLTLQKIQETEDERYMTLLDAAIANYEVASGADMTIVEAGTSGYQPSTIHTAAGLIANNRLQAARILCNAGNYYDFFNWTTDLLGWKAREDITATGKIASYGNLVIKPTVMVTDGKMYLQPEEQYMGYMPVRWSLEPTEWNDPVEGQYGFVFDENIGMSIVNARGIVRIDK